MMQEARFQQLRDTLEEYRKLSLGRIINLIPDKEPKKFLYNLVKDYPLRGGKGFRPGLCIATCKALGGKAESVLNSAASLELFHNAFLVHDDVEDNSLYRRGKPTIHAEHGISIAVNVGDAMNVLSIRPLMDNLYNLGPSLTWQVFSEIEHMVVQSVEGQAIELGWITDNNISLSESDYLKMILKKTCWYTCIHPMRIGALITSGYKGDLDKFNYFGYYMGAAFQIQDDLLNLIGDVKKYGKEIGGDLIEGKRTLMLIHLLNHCSKKEKSELKEYLAQVKPVYDEQIIQWIMHLMEKYGSIEHAKKSAKNLAGAALSEYYRVFGGVPDSKDKQFLEDLVLYMVQRDY